MLNVIAAIIKQNNQFLICQRGAGGSCAYLWEFPGGKLESGESKEECLIRECEEELGIEIKAEGVFAQTLYQYPDGEIAFTFIRARIISGELTPRVHPQVRWVTPEELPDYAFCPADVEVIRMLIKDEAHRV